MVIVDVTLIACLVLQTLVSLIVEQFYDIESCEVKATVICVAVYLYAV